MQINPLFIGIPPILSPKDKRYLPNKNINRLKNIIKYNSPSLSININQNNHFFPSDFFEPISPTNMNSSNQINYNSRNKSKSTYINLQKEEEEDRELLELLEGKRKNFSYYFLFF